jgi:hypothetical protein
MKQAQAWAKILSRQVSGLRKLNRLFHPSAFIVHPY